MKKKRAILLTIISIFLFFGGLFGIKSLKDNKEYDAYAEETGGELKYTYVLEEGLEEASGDDFVIYKNGTLVLNSGSIALNETITSKVDMITTVAIKSGDSTINNGALNQLTNAKELYILGGSVVFGASALENSLIEKVYVNGSVNSIGGNAFKSSAVKEIYFKKLNCSTANIQTTDGGALCYATSLENLTIESAAENITFGQSSFYGTGYAGGFDLYMTGNNITFYYNSFKGTKVKSIEVNGTTTTIERVAFEDSTLANISLYGSVSLGLEAFYKANNLQTIYFDNLISLGSTTSSTYKGIIQGLSNVKSMTIKSTAESLTFPRYFFKESGTDDAEIKIIAPETKITFDMNSFESSKMSSLLVESSDLTINRQGFYKTSAKDVKLDSTNVSIGPEGFVGAGRLENVYIKELNSILSREGNYRGPFYGDGSLKSFYVESATYNCTIGWEAFLSAGSEDGFDFKINGTNVFITNAFDSSKISTFIANCKVLSISANNFQNTTKFKTFISTAYDTRLGYYAFGNSSIETVRIERLTELGSSSGHLSSYGVFKSCTGLKEFTVNNIKDGLVFPTSSFLYAGCADGFDLKFSGNDITFETDSFYQSNVRRIELTGKNYSFEYRSFAGSKATKLLLNTTNTIIGAEAFSYTPLEEIYIKELNRIENPKATPAQDGAFKYCTCLKTVRISAGTKESSSSVCGATSPCNPYIGAEAFLFAGAEEGITFIANIENCTIGGLAFNYTKINTVTFNGDNLFIGTRAFEGSTVKRAVLNTGDTRIGADAFNWCSSLQSIYIRGLTSVAECDYPYSGIFANTTSLEEFVIDNVKDGLVFEEYCFLWAGSENGFDLKLKADNLVFKFNSFTKAHINDFTIIGDNVTFKYRACDDSYIKNLYLYTTNTIIECNAFENGHSLETVYIKELNYLANIIDYELDDGAFENCPKLTNVCIENVIDGGYIGRDSFSSSGSGFDLYISGTNYSVGPFAFGYTNIKTATLKGGDLTLFGGAFKSSTLTDVVLDTTNTVLQVEAFHGCASLKNVYIKELKEICASTSNTIYGTFQSSSAIENIIIESLSDGASIGAKAFNTFNNEVSVNHTNLIIFGDSITFGTDAFYGCHLDNIVLGVDNITLNSDAFNYTNINKFIIKDATTIGTILDTASITYETSTITKSDYIQDPTPEDIEYTKTADGKNLILKSINDKTITSLTLDDRCIEIAEGALDGCDDLTYNVVDGGYYLGNSTNSFYALIKIDANYVQKDETVIYYGKVFNNLSKCNITVNESTTTIDASSYAGTTKVVFEIPSSWDSISSSYNSTSGFTNLDKASNVYIKIPADNNITTISASELEHIYRKPVLLQSKVKFANTPISVSIIDYATNSSDIKVGDMIAGKVIGYDGKVFYIWSIDDGTKDYHAFETTDTFESFMGDTMSPGNEVYYTTPYITAMHGDGCEEGTTVKLTVVALTDEGLVVLGSDTKSLQHSDIDALVPDVVDITIEKTEIYDVNQVLIDKAVPHAVRCITMKDLTITEGSEYATLDGTNFIPSYLGTVTLAYTLNSIDCYDHGGACSYPNKQVVIHIIPAHNSLSIENTYMDVTIDPTSYFYDGTLKTPTITVVDKYNANKVLKYGTDYKYTTVSTPSATNPGTYYITVEGIGSYIDSRTLSWNIDFASISMDDFTYGDDPSEPVITNSTRNDHILRYRLEGSTTYTFEVPKNAGNYIVEAVYKNLGKEPYVISDTFEIKKRNARVTIESKYSEYGDNLATLTGIEEFILEGDSNVYKLTTTATKTSDVGYYDINGTATNSNYNVEFVGGTNLYQIKPKVVTIIWDNDDFTYNGNVQEVHAKYKDINNSDVSLSVEIVDFKDAGDYTATAFLANSETNYILPGDATKNYTMKQKSLKDKSVSYQASISSINYDGNEHTNAITVEDSTATITTNDYELSGDVNVTDAGIKTTIITGKNNYKDSLSVEWHIVGQEFSISVSQEDFEYGDTSKKPLLSENVSGGVVEITYLKVGETIPTTEVPTLVGSYTITYTINGKGAYDKVSASDTFNILKKKIAIPVQSTTIFKYNKTEQTYDLAESTYYTQSNNKRTDVGSQHVCIELIDLDNTIWEDSTTNPIYHTFEIKKADLIINIEDKEKYYLDPNPEFTYVAEGLLSEDTINISLECYDSTSIGKHTITASITTPPLYYNITINPGTLTIKLKGNSDETGEIDVVVTMNKQPIDGVNVYLKYCDFTTNVGYASNGTLKIDDITYGHYSLVVEYGELIYTTPIDIISPSISVTVDFTTDFISSEVGGNVMISSDSITKAYSDSATRDIKSKGGTGIKFTVDLNTAASSSSFDMNSYYQDKDIDGTISDYMNLGFKVAYSLDSLYEVLILNESDSFQNITMPITENLKKAMELGSKDISYLHIYRNVNDAKYGVKEIPCTTGKIAKKAQGDCFYIREVAGTQYIVLHVKDATQYCLALEDTQSKIVKNIPKTTDNTSGDGNIFKCAYHWLILLFIVLYLAVEAGIFMIAPKNEIEAKDSDNEFVKWIKKLSIQNICHLVASLIWFIFFIIGCINAKCFICVVFLIIEFILLLAVVAYVFLPYTKVVVEKMNNWNEKRMEEKKKHPAKEKTYEEVSINKEDAFKDKVVKALKKAWIATQKAFDFAKKKTEQGFDYVMDKTTKGLEKATEVASEAKEQVSLADATKLALAALPTFEISKKTIADYLEGKYKPEDVIVNRKPNVVANTKLPLADTHYAKIMENGKENKACFVYVYELETMFMDKQCTGMLLLIKLNKDLQKDYMKAHKSAKMSAFPIGGQWMAMPIDSSYDWKEVTKILDETYDYQLKEVRNKLAEKKAKAEAKAKA